MSKQSTAYKNNYTANAYDRLSIFIPKGQKAMVEQVAAENGTSINGIFCKALLAYMGLTDWPTPPDTGNGDNNP